MLTSRGALAGAVAALAYLLARLLHYPEFGVLAVAPVAALLVGLAWVVRQPRVTVERTLERSRVTRGETAVGQLTVGNPGRRALSATVGEDRCGDESVLVDLPRLAAGESIEMSYSLPTGRRAVLTVGPLAITRTDPFGLWRRSRHAGGTRRLWVHPVCHPLVFLAPGRLRSLDGPDQSALPHGTVTFHALREYVPGDDLRHVHWRSSARTGTVMVRELVDTSVARVTLVLDVAAAHYSAEGFEEAVEVAASLAVAATRARMPVRLTVTSGQSVQGRGAPADGPAMLDLLAEVRPTAEGSLPDMATRLGGFPPGDVLLVVTGSAPPDQLRAVGALGARVRRGVVAVVAAGPGAPAAPVPSHLRVVRVDRAADFPVQWERLWTR